MRISVTFFLRLFILLILLFGIEFVCVFVSGKRTEATPIVNSSANEFVKNKKQDSIRIEVGTFLGNGSRNYYGDSIGNNLDIIWKTFLGKGTTIVTASKGIEEWFGAGWTGQPLVVRENGKTFLIQGAFDHHLKKINAETGEVIWNYEYDDILKGTGTIWMNDSAKNPLNRIVILQGSRKGVKNSMESPDCSSFRAVSFFTGKELWRMNVTHTASYSRDCDASALIFSDTAYIGLENGKFVKFDPGKIIPENDSVNRPEIYSELPLYNAEDNAHHGGNLVTESSPARIGNHIYITAGSGHVYGYNLQTKEMDWDFYIGSDMDGTPVVTSDSCILVEVEKQYISGKGGIFKLNPRKTVSDCVEWFFPTEDLHFSGWEGGVIGSVALNDSYNDGTYQKLAAFTGIDGNLNVVQYDKISSGEKVFGPDGKTKYPTPMLQFSHHIGPSISTPVFTRGKLVAAGYQGINLFSFDKAGNFELQKTVVNDFEASPVADQGRVYIASRDGYLYCFGDTNGCANVSLSESKSADSQKEKSIALISPEKEKIAVAVPKKENIHVDISDKSFVRHLSRADAETVVVLPEKETLAVVEKPKPVEVKPKPVEVKPKPVVVKPAPPTVITVSPSSGKFHLIAGVFRSEENAENFEKLWKSRGMDAQIFTSPKGMYYVSIGNAASENDLSGLMASVKATYKMDAWIFEK
jgi:outer membrane protein assembly factor BamB